MQFHPQGKVGKYHTILLQKMLVKILTSSKIMKKARKWHKSLLQMSIPLYFIHFWEIKNVPLKGPRNYCYLVGLTFWKCFREKCLESRGRNVELPQKIITFTNILFPAKRNLGSKTISLHTSVYMRGRERGNQDIWRKGKDGIIKNKFLYLNGITSALSAVRVEKTNLAGRDNS